MLSSLGDVPPRDARRLALSFSIRLLSPSCNNWVFSLIPVSLAALAKISSSMLSVVLMQTSLHQNVHSSIFLSLNLSIFIFLEVVGKIHLGIYTQIPDGDIFLNSPPVRQPPDRRGSRSARPELTCGVVPDWQENGQTSDRRPKLHMSSSWFFVCRRPPPETTSACTPRRRTSCLLLSPAVAGAGGEFQVFFASQTCVSMPGFITPDCGHGRNICNVGALFHR